MPKARTILEMQFAASLAPCAHCGSTEPAKLELVGDDDQWTLAGPCPTCRRPRSFQFETEGDPLDAPEPPLRHLGDARPSAIIRPGQLIAELDRLVPRVRLTPSQLAPIEWYASSAALDRAVTCLTELRKFVPRGATEIPEAKLDADERADRKARRERYELAWIDEELEHFQDLLAAYDEDAPRIDALERDAGVNFKPKGAIDADALRAHERWLREGRRGAGRLEVEGYSARAARLGAVNMAEAILTRVTLDEARLEGTVFERATLRDCSAQRAHMTSAQLQGATVVRGTFAGTMLALARFDNAVLDEPDLKQTNLDRSKWPGAKVTAAGFTDARFGNANLDGGTFTGCSMQRADFRPLSSQFKASTKAVFEDCDLRSTRWDGRDVTGASFVRCKLAGARGTPVGLEAATFVDPDLSEDGDGSDIGSAEDVRALLK